MRRLAAACVLALAMGAGTTACSSSNDDSGATTNLDEVGPQIAKLRLEVSQLRREVASLRDELATVTPSTDPAATDPATADATIDTSGG
jgi:hypothetical protein